MELYDIYYLIKWKYLSPTSHQTPSKIWDKWITVLGSLPTLEMLIALNSGGGVPICLIGLFNLTIVIILFI
jgi:hypothetical protein